MRHTAQGSKLVTNLDLTIQPVPESRIPDFRKLVEDYWWELMRTAKSVRDEDSRTEYFNQRFQWNSKHEPPYWALESETPVAFIHFALNSRATIHDFYVVPEARRRGVGSSVVRWALEYFDSKGVNQIDLTARRDQPASLAFWESQGFTIGHYELIMHRDPATGTAYRGALSSDFTESDLGYDTWKER